MSLFTVNKCYRVFLVNLGPVLNKGPSKVCFLHDKQTLKRLKWTKISKRLRGKSKTENLRPMEVGKKAYIMTLG